MIFDKIEDEETYSTIECIIKIAKKLGIGIIAEGVETETQYLILEDMGCEIIQGYYISTPIVKDEYEWLI